jgi:glutamate-1-semialdehyde 2,1-aminomutase
MLDRGIYLACSSYETGFICTEISDEMIEQTIKSASEVFAELKA